MISFDHLFCLKRLLVLLVPQYFDRAADPPNVGVSFFVFVCFLFVFRLLFVCFSFAFVCFCLLLFVFVCFCLLLSVTLFSVVYGFVCSRVVFVLFFV